MPNPDSQEPMPVGDVIRRWRQRGRSFEDIAHDLNTPTARQSWPPPPGAASWSGYLVRAHLNGGRA